LGAKRGDFQVEFGNQSRILFHARYPELSDEMICYVVKQFKDFFGVKGA
jgi:hypothetical protein